MPEGLDPLPTSPVNHLIYLGSSRRIFLLAPESSLTRPPLGRGLAIAGDGRPPVACGNLCVPNPRRTGHAGYDRARTMQRRRREGLRSYEPGRKPRCPNSRDATPLLRRALLHGSLEVVQTLARKSQELRALGAGLEGVAAVMPRALPVSPLRDVFVTFSMLWSAAQSRHILLEQNLAS